MGKAIDNGSVSETTDHASLKHARTRDLRKSMSDNVAFALIVYTALQIFFTVHAMKEGISSTAPYFALVILIAAIIPACRWFEKRWINLSDEDAQADRLLGAYRRDQILLWAMAIGLPAVLTGLFMLIF